MTNRLDNTPSLLSIFMFIGITAIALLVLMAISKLDYQDELKEQEIYCKNVKSKLWPDYKKIYAVECGQYEKSVDVIK